MSAARFEAELPSADKASAYADIAINTWRSLRNLACQGMKNSSERNLLYTPGWSKLECLMDYKVSDSHKIIPTEDLPVKAMRFLQVYAESNGWKALKQLEKEWADSRSKNSLYPFQIADYVSKSAKAVPCNDMTHIWLVEFAGGSTFEIRMNDFPDEPLYTAVSRSGQTVRFNDWPKKWNRSFDIR